MTIISHDTSAVSMQALVFDGALRVGHLPRPVPGPGEVLIRVSICGISRADLDMIQGRRPVQVRPIILGHQFVGEVEATGDPTAKAWIGKRVVAQPHRGCGGCGACRRKERWLCMVDRGRALGMGLIDGAFAEWIVAHVDSLIEVPDSVDDEDASFAYPVASALAAIDHVVGPPPQRILVVGDGNMGLLITLMLHAAGHTVSVLGRHPSRRDLLWRSGISFSGVQAGTDGDARPEDDFARGSFSTVFECSGKPSGLELALGAARPRGRLVLVSYHGGQPGFELSRVVENEIELWGVNGGSLLAAVNYLESRKLDTLPLVSGRLPLSKGADGFQQAIRRGTLRILLENETAYRGGM